MKFFKVVSVSFFAFLSISSLHASQPAHNFRSALLTTGEQYCLKSQGLSKLSPDDKCFGSFGAVMQPKFIDKVLRKNDTLVKSADFHRKCKKHVVGSDLVEASDADNYCSDMYEHFKASHELFLNSPRMNYLTK